MSGQKEQVRRHCVRAGKRQQTKKKKKQKREKERRHKVPLEKFKSGCSGGDCFARSLCLVTEATVLRTRHTCTTNASRLVLYDEKCCVREKTYTQKRRPAKGRDRSHGGNWECPPLLLLFCPLFPPPPLLQLSSLFSSLLSPHPHPFLAVAAVSLPLSAR